MGSVEDTNFKEGDIVWYDNQASSPEGIADNNTLFTLCRIIHKKEDDEVMLSKHSDYNGNIFTSKVKNIQKANHLFTFDQNDMIKLKHINGPTLLNHLHERFKNKKFYTRMGPLLIFVNPNMNLNLNNEQTIRMHKFSRTPGEGNLNEYTVALSALRNLSMLKRNQSIIVTGESGSGKSEITKNILNFLAYQAEGNESEANQLDEASQVDDTVVSNQPNQGRFAETIAHVNVLLDAFGSAKTRKNNNSSRLSKFFTLYIDEKGRVKSMHVKKFLFEKDRLMGRSGTGVEGGDENGVEHERERENSFNIFYYILNGSSEKFKEMYYLKDVKYYKMLRLRGSLRKGKTMAVDEKNRVNEANAMKENSVDDNIVNEDTIVDGIVNDDTANEKSSSTEDAAKFLELLKSLNYFFDDDKEIDFVFSILSGLLLLGNVETVKMLRQKSLLRKSLLCESSLNYEELQNFLEDSNEDLLIDDNVKNFLLASKLLGMNPQELVKYFTTKYVFNDILLMKVHNETKIHRKMESFIKTIYDELFNWVLHKVNCKLGALNGGDLASSQKENVEGNYINVLDLSYFEKGEKNSLTELLINTSNEAVRKMVVDFLFKKRMNLCREEGIIEASSSCNLEQIDNEGLYNVLVQEGEGSLFSYLEYLSIGKYTEKSNLHSLILKKFSNEGEYIKKTPSNISGEKSRKSSSSSFTIVHTCGEVPYSSDELISQNIDILTNNFIDLMKKSGNPYLEKLCCSYNYDSTGNIVEEKRRYSIQSALKLFRRKYESRNQMAVTMLRNSLIELMKVKESTFCHFIFCMNSNHNRENERGEIINLFDERVVFEQVQSMSLTQFRQLKGAGLFPHAFYFQELLDLLDGPVESNAETEEEGAANEEGAEVETVEAVESNAEVAEEGADEEEVDEEEVDKEGVDKEGVDKEGVDKEGVDKEGVDKEEVTEQEVTEQEVAEQEVTEKEVAEQEVAEQEVTEGENEDYTQADAKKRIEDMMISYNISKSEWAMGKNRIFLTDTSLRILIQNKWEEYRQRILPKLVAVINDDERAHHGREESASKVAGLVNLECVRMSQVYKKEDANMIHQMVKPGMNSESTEGNSYFKDIIQLMHLEKIRELYNSGGDKGKDNKGDERDVNGADNVSIEKGGDLDQSEESNLNQTSVEMCGISHILNNVPTCSAKMNDANETLNGFSCTEIPLNDKCTCCMGMPNFCNRHSSSEEIKFADSVDGSVVADVEKGEVEEGQVDQEQVQQGEVQLEEVKLENVEEGEANGESMEEELSNVEQSNGEHLNGEVQEDDVAEVVVPAEHATNGEEEEKKERCTVNKDTADVGESQEHDVDVEGDGSVPSEVDGGEDGAEEAMIGVEVVNLKDEEEDDEEDDEGEIEVEGGADEQNEGEVHVEGAEGEANDVVVEMEKEESMQGDQVEVHDESVDVEEEMPKAEELEVQALEVEIDEEATGEVEEKVEAVDEAEAKVEAEVEAVEDMNPFSEEDATNQMNPFDEIDDAADEVNPPQPEDENSTKDESKNPKEEDVDEEYIEYNLNCFKAMASKKMGDLNKMLLSCAGDEVNMIQNMLDCYLCTEEGNNYEHCFIEPTFWNPLDVGENGLTEYTAELRNPKQKHLLLSHLNEKYITHSDERIHLMSILKNIVISMEHVHNRKWNIFFTSSDYYFKSYLNNEDHLCLQNDSIDLKEKVMLNEECNYQKNKKEKAHKHRYSPIVEYLTLPTGKDIHEICLSNNANKRYIKDNYRILCFRSRKGTKLDFMNAKSFYTSIEYKKVKTKNITHVHTDFSYMDDKMKCNFKQHVINEFINNPSITMEELGDSLLNLATYFYYENRGSWCVFVSKKRAFTGVINIVKNRYIRMTAKNKKKKYHIVLFETPV
ncbi:myosin-like protein, putative [Plasmodium knowlesi strain H]|uniref:Myosin-like protein, putative n=3 Tax=Plasmodium knowlesi TaxID=5850 RepID=A0A5K1VJV9_PLAKH|nr:myosin E, putative [Plasmodium knowlesi strain H]OTN64353.1 putative Myosin-like protein [Plasmodium knowlesi]CAA9989186.1 myosin E, putative [Plasmodium knowlesi strain H]SBO27407.1 myosin-like protein, putative [Plasmodium knowlesi strain H]SBO27440.1 myosin-like protein, putative [Plasmodium knowlesi strain H]VVS78660.1 myosin E, putative [Plasmodium knowlesi strain H]|eukprot:XP_002261533.1 myosin-like protein, putative [Plasmodium knowlesi strain H]